MKVCFFFFLLFLTDNLYSQSTASGYYINKNSDTITVEIKIKKGVFGQATNNFRNEIEVIDSINGSKVFTPDDIKGYGFLYKGIKYTFVSKPVKNGSYDFLVPVLLGSKTSLYQHGIYTSTGAFANNQVFYTFEKADGTYLFLKNILNKKFKSQLKIFYKDNAEAQHLIDTKLRYWLDLQKDLKEIVQVVNKS